MWWQFWLDIRENESGRAKMQEDVSDMFQIFVRIQVSRLGKRQHVCEVGLRILKL